ncbi:MAG: hypothetical protein HC848_09985 [Limnobacter sp.]|nr:hypothetical protein [Limnobacter sp.]
METQRSSGPISACWLPVQTNPKPPEKFPSACDDNNTGNSFIPTRHSDSQLATPGHPRKATSAFACGALGLGQALLPHLEKVSAFSTLPKRLAAYHLDSTMPWKFKPANIAVVGGNIKGVIAAINLQRQGHQVTLYETRDALCHNINDVLADRLGALAPCHLSQSKQIERFKSGLAFARLFPEGICLRPTVFALRQNDTVHMNNAPQTRPRNPADLAAAARLAQAEYKKAIEADPNNAVFGPVEHYQGLYSRSQVNTLRERPLVNPPRSNDDWVGNWAHEMTEEALDELQYPVVLMHEAQINFPRLSEQVFETLHARGVTLHTGQPFALNSLPNNKSGAYINKEHFDYAVNGMPNPQEKLTHRFSNLAVHRTSESVGRPTTLLYPATILPQMRLMGSTTLELVVFDKHTSLIHSNHLENAEIPHKKLTQTEQSIHELTNFLPRLCAEPPVPPQDDASSPWQPEKTTLLFLNENLEVNRPVFDVTYKNKEGKTCVIINKEHYVEIREAGRGFSSEAYIYENSRTKNQIIIKKFFLYRSKNSPGDMNSAPPENPQEREQLMKKQLDDFSIEVAVFKALSAQPASKYIAHAIRCGMHEGKAHIVMPYFNGGSLRDMCTKLNMATEHEAISMLQRHQCALYLMRQVLCGLKRLSGVIIHRDLKPENIFLDLESKGDNSLKLLQNSRLRYCVFRRSHQQCRTHLTQLQITRIFNYRNSWERAAHSSTRYMVSRYYFARTTNRLPPF